MRRIFLIIVILNLASCIEAVLKEKDIPNIIQANRLWIKNNVKWAKAPSGFTDFQRSAPAEVLYFSNDNKLYIVYCMLYETPKAVFIGREGYNLYYGTWILKEDHVAIAYKIVPTASLVVPTDEKLLLMHEKNPVFMSNRKMIMGGSVYVPLKKMSEEHIRKMIIPPIEYYENTLGKSP